MQVDSLLSEPPGLISFRMDWLDLLAAQGTLRSLLQHHSLKASVLQCYIDIKLAPPRTPLLAITAAGGVVQLQAVLCDPKSRGQCGELARTRPVSWRLSRVRSGIFNKLLQPFAFLQCDVWGQQALFMCRFWGGLGWAWESAFLTGRTDYADAAGPQTPPGGKGYMISIPSEALNHSVLKAGMSLLLFGIYKSPGGSVIKNPPAVQEDLGLIPGSGRSPGGGHDNPLQYCCLETPTDRGAWQAAGHGVTKSQLQLSD